ncbi:MAG: hypothetical protein KF774_11340 [Planctomyces sp.]|nr:hypothetical protein [Planctomyces sp.]
MTRMTRKLWAAAAVLMMAGGGGTAMADGGSRGGFSKSLGSAQASSRSTAMKTPTQRSTQSQGTAFKSFAGQGAVQNAHKGTPQTGRLGAGTTRLPAVQKPLTGGQRFPVKGKIDASPATKLPSTGRLPLPVKGEGIVAKPGSRLPIDGNTLPGLNPGRKPIDVGGLTPVNPGRGTILETVTKEERLRDRLAPHRDGIPGIPGILDKGPPYNPGNPGNGNGNPPADPGNGNGQPPADPGNGQPPIDPGNGNGQPPVDPGHGGHHPPHHGHDHWHWPLPYPVPIFYPTPRCHTVFVNGCWTPCTQPLYFNQIDVIPMPVVGQALPEIPAGATFRLDIAGLGPNQGGAGVDVRGIGMTVEVLQWDANSVVVQLPYIVLNEAARSDLAIVRADGSVAHQLPFLMLPADQAMLAAQ